MPITLEGPCPRIAIGTISKSKKKKEKERLRRTKSFSQVISKRPASGVELISFENPDKHSIPSSTLISKYNPVTDSSLKNERASVRLEMRQTRFEIMKFGMNSLKGKEKEDAEAALAISLGAKPPKNSAQNYKEILIAKKASKEREKKELENGPPKVVTNPNRPASSKKKKTQKKSLETTGIYKVKVHPTASGNKNFKSKKSFNNPRKNKPKK